MSTFKIAGRIMAVATIGALTGCGNGGSNTTRNPDAPSQYAKIFEKTTAPNPSTVVINQDNANEIAGSALKALLLSDISANAVDNAVTVTREQNTEVVDMASGIVITMQPVACLYDGNFSMVASLESTNDQIQLNLEDDLNMSFSTTFNNCNQGSATLSGSVSLDFTAIINDIINTNNFSLDTFVSINQLSIEQSGFTPFVVNGNLSYKMSSHDDIVLNTTVNATDVYYQADNSYQVIEYTSFKTVNLPTGEYQYTVNSSFVDYMVSDSLIEYQTVEPISGVGFSVPSSGSIIVYGAGQVMFINVLNIDSIEIEIDYNGDSAIDEVIYSSWSELALNSLFVQQG